jgi:acetyl esterase/lipase
MIERDSTEESLSDAGRDRKVAMLAALCHEVRIRPRRRARARAALVGCAAGLLVAGSLWLTSRDRQPDPLPSGQGLSSPLAGAQESADHSAAVFELVHDDPGITERCRMSDDELMALLAEAQQPTGIIRVDGKLILAMELESEDGAQPFQ